MAEETEPYRIPLEAVESSNLAGYGYGAGGQVLAVQFKNGRIFHYANVPLETALEFGAAQSKGTHYAANIRGKFSGSCVTGKCQKCGSEGYLGDTCGDCGCATYTAQERRYEHAATQRTV